MSNGLASTTGLASGIDTASIVQKLMALESRPITTMKTKLNTLSSQSNLLSSIKVNLMSLQSSASNLTLSATFGGRKVSSSDSTNSVATAVAQNGAVNSSYAVVVNKTATTTTYVSSRLGSAQVASSTAVTSAKQLTDTGLATGVKYDLNAINIGHAGNFTINGLSVSIDGTESINGVISKINAQAGGAAGVTASIDSNNRIVLTNNTKGANALSIVATDAGDILSYLKLDTANLLTQYGQDEQTTATGWSAGSAAVKTGTAIPGGVTSANLNAQFGAGSPALGSFTINGAKITVADTDTVNTVLNKITSSAAGVTASIVGGAVVLTQKTVGDIASKPITITAGTDGNTALDALGLTGATTTSGGANPDGSNVLKDTALFGGMFTATKTSGYFSINGTYIYIDGTKDTLNNVIAKINQSSAGVLANFNSDTNQITITSKTAGANDITFGNSTTDSLDFVNRADLTGSQNTVPNTTDTIKGGKVAGQEADVTINGTSVVTKNSTATLNGVTFTFLGKSATSSSVVLTVQNDTDKTVQAVQDFVKNYNTVNDQLQSIISQKPDSTSTDASQGILFGDPMLTSLASNLRSLLSAVVGGADSKYMQLSQLGITTGTSGSSVDSAKTGTLTLDTDKLTQALSDNPDAVANLLGKSNRIFAEKTTLSISSATLTLANHPLSQAFQPQVTVDGLSFSYTSSFSSDPTTKAKQFTVDYKTGIITFGTTLNAGQVVSANYDYDVSNAGIAARFKSIIAGYTKYGGSFDARIGSNGSIPSEVKDINDQITSKQARLDQRQQTLEKQFTAMETMLSSLQSQSNAFNSLLGSLSSSK